VLVRRANAILVGQSQTSGAPGADWPGYLWSPKTEARGTRSQFYDNMRKAAPGDIVLSYAAGRVGRVGIVTDFALEAQKPTEFGSAGSYWDTVGWLLPMGWFEASLSVRPKDLLDRLAPLLPGTHASIQPATGNGNQKAYLAEVEGAVVELVLEAAGLRLAAFIDREVNRPASDFSSTLDDMVETAIMHDLRSMKRRASN
jgi:putative restriction endonuclease